MTEPRIYGLAPTPLANEIITIVALVSALSGLAFMVWRIQRDGLTSLRRSVLMIILCQVMLSAYWAYTSAL